MGMNDAPEANVSKPDKVKDALADLDAQFGNKKKPPTVESKPPVSAEEVAQKKEAAKVVDEAKIAGIKADIEKKFNPKEPIVAEEVKEEAGVEKEKSPEEQIALLKVAIKEDGQKFLDSVQDLLSKLSYGQRYLIEEAIKSAIDKGDFVPGYLGEFMAGNPPEMSRYSGIEPILVSSLGNNVIFTDTESFRELIQDGNEAKFESAYKRDIDKLSKNDSRDRVISDLKKDMRRSLSVYDAKAQIVKNGSEYKNDVAVMASIKEKGKDIFADLLKKQKELYKFDYKLRKDTTVA